jgi:hypothetical protein
MQARSWIKRVLTPLPLLLLILSACARAEPTPTPIPIPTLLPADTETRVDMTPGSASRLYNFSATRLKINSRTPGFAFSAEVRNAAGQTVAAFANQLEDVQFTLTQDVGLYQIAVSAVNPQQAGTISLALGSAASSPALLDGTAYRAANCRIKNNVGVNTIIRSAPAPQYAVLALFPADTSLPVIGQTDNGWYSVNFAERQGWVFRDVIALEGDCAALPIVRNPAIPSAPADAQAYLLQADRDGRGSFREEISAPDGDTSDLVWVRVVNLDSVSPNNYREFVLTLDCVGEGSEVLRWGSPTDPSLKCGETVVLPFLNTSAERPIVVLFPTGSPQSHVDYLLSMLPAGAVG